MQQKQLEWIQQLQDLCLVRHIRACLVLCGSAEWQTKILQNIFTVHHQGLWVGSNCPISHAQVINPQQATHYLGQETDFVVFNALDGLEPNLLGIFSGMIKAGGLCIINLPDKATWLNTPNPAMQKYLSYPWQLSSTRRGFNQLIWQILQSHALVLRENQTVPPLPTFKSPLPRVLLSQLPTVEQQQGLEKIQQVAFGHRKRPLVITADRGRGKSTLLGLSAVALVHAGKRSVVITAARRDQVQAAFRVIETSGVAAQIHFKAPDDCLNSNLTTDVLMIDEAAHLPLPLLFRLVQKYHRLVLASTEQGYEGSGRGFSIKLGQALNKLTPGWQKWQLTTPIRWATDDLLEPCIQACLFQTAQTPPEKTPHKEPTAISISETCLTPQAPEQLNALFQLLSHAHYQTSPNDLMQLLETPNLKVWQAQTPSGEWVGALIAISEGDLPNPFKQRYQGHLFAQLQAKNTHNAEWFGLKGWRIMRIAVAETWQNQGIGSNLVGKCMVDCSKNAAYLATNFGATPGLVNFWQKNGFLSLHLGAKRDKASGVHALSMAKGLTEKSVELIETQSKKFYAQLFYNLSDIFQDLDPKLIQSLYLGTSLPQNAHFPLGYLTDDAWAQPYESVSADLALWFLKQLSINSTQGLDESVINLMIAKLLQKQDWANLITPTWPGRKVLEKKLKETCQILLKQQP